MKRIQIPEEVSSLFQGITSFDESTVSQVIESIDRTAIAKGGLSSLQYGQANKVIGDAYLCRALSVTSGEPGDDARIAATHLSIASDTFEDSPHVELLVQSLMNNANAIRLQAQFDKDVDAKELLNTAVSHYERAVKLSEAIGTEAWPQALFDHASALRERSELSVGSDALADLEKGAANYSVLSEIWNEPNEERARLLVQWSIVLRQSAERRTGTESNNDLLQALKNYEEASAIGNSLEDTELIAMSEANKATVHITLAGRSSGRDYVGNLDGAKLALENSLGVWTEDVNPRGRAHSLLNLGIVHGRRADSLSGDDATTAFDEALDNFHNAISVWTNIGDNRGPVYAKINRAMLLRRRAERGIGQSSIDDLSKAVLDYQAVVEAWNSGESAEGFARASAGLGSVLVTRSEKLERASSRADLDNAIEAFQAALEIWSSEVDTEGRADTLVNLAAAHRLRASLSNDQEKGRYIDNAIRCGEQAIHIWKSGANKDGLAYAHLGLARSLIEEFEFGASRSRDLFEKLEAGVEHLKTCLEIWKKETEPENWAAANECLGNCLSKKGKISDGKNREKAIVECISKFENALTIWDRYSAPLNWIICTIQIGRAYGSLDQSQTAVTYLSEAFEFGRSKALASLDTQERNELLRSLRDVSEELASFHLEAGEYQLAVEVLEAGRGIAHSADVSAASLSEEKPLQEKTDTFRKNIAESRYLLTELRQTQAQIVSDDRISAKAREQRLEDLLKERDRVRSDLESKVESYHEFLNRKKFADQSDGKDAVASHASGVVLAVFSITERGSGIVIIEDDREHEFAELPKSVFLELTELIYGSNAWLDGYRRFAASLTSEDVKERTKWQLAWATTVERTLIDVWRLVMEPLHRHLASMGYAGNGETEVVLCAPGWLSILPLHAASESFDEASAPSFLDAWSVSYSQNIGTYLLNSRRKESRHGKQGVVLRASDPLGDLGDFASTDSTEVINLERTQATRAAILENLTSAAEFRYLGHAVWHPEDPSQSGLVVSGDEANSGKALLTSKDIYRIGPRLEKCRVWSLAACETGLIDTDIQNEFSGLAHAANTFVPCVVATLYPVDFQSGKAIVEAFHGAHSEAEQDNDSLTPTKAMRSTLLAMRRGGLNALAEQSHHKSKSTPILSEMENRVYTRPFFWAGFCVFGC